MLNIRYALGGQNPCRELWLVQEKKPSPLPQGTHYWLGKNLTQPRLLAGSAGQCLMTCQKVWPGLQNWRDTQARPGKA